MSNLLPSLARIAVAAAVAVVISARVAIGAVSSERALAVPALTTFTVTNTNDSGAGSLRQAIAAANVTPGADTIRITAGGTVHLLSTLHITDELSILGPGADRFALDGGGNVPVFDIGYVVVDSSGNPTIVPVPVSIANLSVQHGNARKSYGGGIHSTGALTLTNVSMVNNTAIIGGGADVDGAIVLNGGRFENNSAQLSGGGLRAWNTLTITDTQFVNNTAGFQGGDGGGVSAFGSVTSNGARFENNHCAPAFSSLACIGGGLAVAFKSRLTDTQFVGNTADDDGGGLWGYGTVTLNGGQFANNRCVADSGCSGGGVYTKTMLNIDGTRFSSNTALFRGGGAYSDGAAEISAGRFENNGCVADANCDGGGVYVKGTLSLSATQFLSNTAHGNGGGLYGANTTQISGGRIANNTAQYGGGLAVFNTLHLTGTQLLSNTAQFDGGGLYLFRADTTSVITTPNTLHEAQFIGNNAQRGGGLIMGYVGDVANSLFARNTAATGTAMLLGEPNIANDIGLRHVTISGPAPMAGAAIVVTSGVVFVHNSIISNQAVGISRKAGFVKEDANLFFGNRANTVGGVISGIQDISGDPRFADPAHDDYHLAAGSAAIDSVGPFSIFTDIDGEMRPFGLRFDAGFDEYVPTPISGLSIVVSPIPTTTLGRPTTFAARIAKGTSPITYTWDFGDRTPSQSGAYVSHIYALRGDFTATVTATNSMGRVSTALQVHIVAAQPDPTPNSQVYLPLLRR